jgi:hypothetical protein
MHVAKRVYSKAALSGQPVNGCGWQLLKEGVQDLVNVVPILENREKACTTISRR